MKMTIPLKKLLESVEKSSIGALTKESQDEDRKKIRPTDACLKISTNKNSVVFESSSQEASVFYSIPVGEDMVVELDGSFCVEASQYLKMLKTIPKDYLIHVSYEEDKNYGKDMLSKMVQPNGKLITTAISDKSKKRKGSNDTYPVSEFTKVDYNHNNVLFSMNSKVLAQCIDKVLFARELNDLSGVFDKVSIFISNKKLFFACTDGKRCAIYSVAESEAKVMVDEQKILVNGELLKAVCESFEKDEEVKIINSEDKEHIILSSDKIKVRLSTASEEVKQSFPNFLNLMGLSLPIAIDVVKSDLLSAVDFLSVYNAEKSIFHVEKGKNEIKIDVARGGADPETVIVECNEIKDSLQNPIALSNSFTKDGCKKISGDKIKISFSKDEKKVKIESPNDAGFVYFMQCMTVN